MVGTSILMALQLTLTHVSRLKECLTTTPIRKVMGGNVHRSVHTVRHVSTTAGSAEKFKVVLHQPDIVIGQVMRLADVNSVLMNSVLQLTENSPRVGKG